MIEYVELLLILAAWLAAVTFCAAYPFLAPVSRWTREGWHMWSFTLALVSLGASSIVRRVWPGVMDSPAYTVVVTLTYTALAVLLWWRVALLATAANHDRTHN